MQTDSSALRTWRASWSAVEYTATVSSPSSRQARITRSAISPRLATRTLRTRSGRLGGLEGDDVRPRVDEALVLDQELRDDALRLADDLVEALHDLDQADDVAGVHLVALVDVRLGLGVRAPVERAGERRLDRLGQDL